jgi:cell division transport system ATP-binding protein
MIKLKNVSKIYDNSLKALDNINLSIERKEFVFIVGYSGAGKSTLLRLLTHEDYPSFGEVIVNSVNVFKLRKKEIPYFRRTIGRVYQDFRLIPSMSVFDNVALAMRAIGVPERKVKERVPYILSLVGLQDKLKRLPRALSGGERQRVGIARALVNNPDLIILDEPTGNIDPELSYEIVDLLNEINLRGPTVVMVTHEQSLVDKFNKRTLKLQDGKIISDTGKPQDNKSKIDKVSSAPSDAEHGSLKLAEGG